MKGNKLNIILIFVLIIVVCGMIYATKLKSNNKSKVSTTKNEKTTTQKKEEEKINYIGELRVYNAADYMSESTIRDFEKEYKIKVVYSEFESNEAMYDDIVKNPSKYDVLVPSDYMIDRLIQEGRLEKINKDNIPNISNVASEYLNPEYDRENEYVVPYMTGTLGILYNKKLVNGEITSWSSLFDNKYTGQIWMWDSMRDVVGIALKSLGYSMNTVDENELEEAKAALIKQVKIIRGYAEEEARDAMIADEGTLALVYAGEAKSAIDQNPNLAYVIPEEGSNKFVDGFVIVKDAKNKEAAEKFINFMCRSNIAVRNMTDIGYTSPIKGAWSEFGNNKIMSQSTEELDRCEALLYDRQATEKYNRMWRDIRGN